jgi:hypothetical protein
VIYAKIVLIKQFCESRFARSSSNLPSGHGVIQTVAAPWHELKTNRSLFSIGGAPPRVYALK